MQAAIHINNKPLVKPLAAVPCVSIILPFEPKMSPKSTLQYRLKRVMGNTELQLLKQYPFHITCLLQKKMEELVDVLDYSTHTKSIALFISEDIQKVYYLDMEVQEKIIIKRTFEIKDIVSGKQQRQQYLLLILGAKGANLYLGYENRMQLLVANSDDHPEAKVPGSPGEQDQPGLHLKKFLHHVDDGLSIILKAYPFPLMLACSTKTRRLFNEVSKNTNHVVEYLPGDYENCDESELKNLIKPYLLNWQKIKETDLLLQLKRAACISKCSAGINDVYKAACEKRVKLLVVEKSYGYPLLLIKPHSTYATVLPANKNDTSTKDAVEDIIDKVLENGGDVEFMCNGLLTGYKQIAVIEFNDSCDHIH